MILPIISSPNKIKTQIMITGGNGLLGSAIIKILGREYNDIEVFAPTSKELDLTDREKTLSYFRNGPKFDCVLHLAAKVGGIKANTDYIGDFYSINARINQNVLDSCLYNDIPELISVLSTCIYPDSEYVKYPLTEDQLHNGPPHESNYGYAYAKRMLEVQSRAYNKQYGCNFICVIPNNLFGYPNDNFDLNNSHVIPALIRKIFEAKINNNPVVEIWGSGKVYREFTYSYDAAKIIAKIALHNISDDLSSAYRNALKTSPAPPRSILSHKTYPGMDLKMSHQKGFKSAGYKFDDQVRCINIGNPHQHTIEDIALTIRHILDYKGSLYFNREMPEGIYKKPSSNQKLINSGLWKNEYYTSFENALKETCEWFVSQYPKIKGINK